MSDSSSTGPVPMSNLSPELQDFLLDYPQLEGSDSASTANVDFYRNLSAMRPSGMLLKTFMRDFKGHYHALEMDHRFIQWLFPLRVLGHNPDAAMLTKREREIFRGSHELQFRVRQSLLLMLDFFGFEIIDDWTLQMARKKDYQLRYANLVRSTHNDLRISRILMSLSELGMEQYNVPILLWLLHEQSQGELNDFSKCNSMDNYWIHCMRNVNSRTFVAEVKDRVRQGHVMSEAQYVAILKQKRQSNVWRYVDEQN